MDVYLYAHFILHGVVHNTDAALIFTRHYCHVSSERVSAQRAIVSQLRRKLAAFVSVIQH